MTLSVRGHVQGVGFRWWVQTRLRELGLTGSATNLADGSVEVAAQGDRTALERLVQAITAGHAPGRVTGTTVHWDPT